jgi:hypothetical protein
MVTMPLDIRSCGSVSKVVGRSRKLARQQRLEIAADHSPGQKEP